MTQTRRASAGLEKTIGVFHRDLSLSTATQTNSVRLLAKNAAGAFVPLRNLGRPCEGIFNEETLPTSFFNAWRCGGPRRARGRVRERDHAAAGRRTADRQRRAPRR